MPTFDEPTIAGIPQEPWKGIQYICRVFFEFDETIPRDREVESYEEYVECIAVLEAFQEAKGLPLSRVGFGQEAHGAIIDIREKFRVASNKSQIEIATSHHESVKTRIAAQFGKSYVYELSDGDITRIQELLDALRKEIVACSEIEEKHRTRVIAKLEKLQRELYKKESDLDKYFGIAGEVLALAKKGGEAALPWVKCVKEILEIVWRAQSRSLQLPSSTPMDLLTVKDDVEKKTTRRG